MTTANETRKENNEWSARFMAELVENLQHPLRSKIRYYRYCIRKATHKLFHPKTHDKFLWL